MTIGVQLFERTLISSLEAALMVGVLLLLIRLLRGKLTSGWRYALWMLLIAKLILPWMPGDLEKELHWLRFPEKVEVHMPIVDQWDISMSSANKEAQSQAFQSGELVNAANKWPQQEAGNKMFLQLAAWVWLIGVAAVVVSIGSSYLAALFATRVHVEVQVPSHVQSLYLHVRSQMGIRRSIALRLTDSVNTPTLFGLFRPTVLIPMHLAGRLDESDWECIFRHELTHFKRRDVIVNTAFALLAALHWFNPAIWYALHRLRIDQEEACDASVLTRAELKESYASCIVKVLEISVSRRQASAGVGFSGYKNQMARRITMIKDFKPAKSRISILGLTIIVIAALLLLPSAFAAGKEETGNSNEVPPSEQASSAPQVLEKPTSEPLSFSMPAAGKVTVPFGIRIHPVSGKEKLHDGIDLVNKKGTPVYAAAEGVVIKAEYVPVNGMTVVIKHNNSWTTEYRHLSELKSVEGQQVKSGDLIGLMGSTGQATGSHLHFSVIKEGVYIDPTEVLRP
ncbi:M23/M56 family metallopeptidase [Paenibacillus sp. NEAU-GSW1]|uniref:M23/M56 family metallopeptidase n=1 Tax=Paenibacillus sp. NEAU-GSW1 TaxID=2682486 RepID=UPI0012E28161|nr:M23/M56 family metallopeptidase [Paenibacillus sp. NEAU-GSW1]MUT64716.1 peptidoglycan DD-metalloendopeptidase family protein [Paenibacillus sp. NEAU-GSW1]